MIAFWKYDLFPGCLSGKVDTQRLAERNDGKVFVPSFGHWFKPMLTMPDEIGLPIATKLEELREEYAREQKELSDKYRQKAREIASFL